MKALLVARRELAAYLRSPIGYVVIAAGLLIEGIYFYARGLSDGAHLSAEVLQTFFDGSSGVITVVAVLLSMRLIAGERENQTLVLLNTAPVRERDVVLGKFLAGSGFLAIMIALSSYMPLLVFVNGKVSVGHVLVGYFGLLQLATAEVAVGLFASALASTQVVAAISGGVMLGVFFLLFYLARASDPPLKEFLAGLLLFQSRWAPTMKGILKLENLVFTTAVAYFFLLAATKTMEARRWR
ncbi:MAG TPA: ABC transporter permease [Minicystis sp.]|nr:ABC transporter permease [Minicystis sp.]